MASIVRALTNLLVRALVTEQKKARLDLLKLKVGTVFHADASPAITTANATDEATLVALANALKASYNAHAASACHATTGQGAHIAADAANLVTAANATDTASANTLLNELKADYNTHRAATTFHPTADATNAVSSADGTDEGTGITLANEIKVDLNAHYAAAFGHDVIEDIRP